MIVAVDVSLGDVKLDELSVLDRFHVSANGDDAAVVRALGAHGRQADRPGHVLVEIAWVRSKAAAHVDDDWARRFEAMIDYARRKGWTNAEGTHLMAHVEAPRQQ